MSNYFWKLFTPNAVSIGGKVLAFVSQQPKSPRVNVILCGELLYTCNETMSNFVFFVYLIDEIVT